MSDGTFLVNVTGQVEYADVLAGAGTSWHCKYEFWTGPDWKIIGGMETGLSQIANVVNNGDKVVLNFPVDVQFKSTSPYGWPQIVLSIYRHMTLEGYGRAHLPLRPGYHKLNVNIARPTANTMWGYIGSIFGYQPELNHPKILASTTDTEYHGTKYFKDEESILKLQSTLKIMLTNKCKNSAHLSK